MILPRSRDRLATPDTDTHSYVPGLKYAQIDMRIVLDVAQFPAPSAVTNHKSAPVARFWFAMARDSRCPSGRRVVIIATLISSIMP